MSDDTTLVPPRVLEYQRSVAFDAPTLTTRVRRLISWGIVTVLAASAYAGPWWIVRLASGRAAIDPHPWPRLSLTPAEQIGMFYVRHPASFYLLTAMVVASAAMTLHAGLRRPWSVWRSPRWAAFATIGIAVPIGVAATAVMTPHLIVTCHLSL